MVEHLPEFVDPLMLADKRRHFNGVLPLSKMPRLLEMLLVKEGGVKFGLKFGKEGKIASVTGTIDAELVLQCQCCLGPIAWPVHSRVSLAVVASLDEADLLPENYEPLLLEGETIALADIVQDELLLAIPCVPQHDHCGTVPQGKKAPEPKAPERTNPFAVLSELKK